MDWEGSVTLYVRPNKNGWVWLSDGHCGGAFRVFCPTTKDECAVVGARWKLQYFENHRNLFFPCVIGSRFCEPVIKIGVWSLLCTIVPQ